MLQRAVAQKPKRLQHIMVARNVVIVEAAMISASVDESVITSLLEGGVSLLLGILARRGETRGGERFRFRPPSRHPPTSPPTSNCLDLSRSAFPAGSTRNCLDLTATVMDLDPSLPFLLVLRRSTRKDGRWHGPLTSRWYWYPPRWTRCRCGFYASRGPTRIAHRLGAQGGLLIGALRGGTHRQ